jgi:hypothetical protein
MVRRFPFKVCKDRPASVTFARFQASDLLLAAEAPRFSFEDTRILEMYDAVRLRPVNRPISPGLR